MHFLQEAEIAKLTAMLQKTEMKAKSLEQTVEQKAKENEVKYPIKFNYFWQQCCLLAKIEI